MYLQNCIFKYFSSYHTNLKKFATLTLLAKLWKFCSLRSQNDLQTKLSLRFARLYLRKFFSLALEERPAN